jgi:hypothetical protein
MDTAKTKAIEIIRKQGGIIRTHEALGQGIHRRTLYGLREEGALIPTARALYQLAEMESFPTESTWPSSPPTASSASSPPLPSTA